MFIIIIIDIKFYNICETHQNCIYYFIMKILCCTYFIFDLDTIDTNNFFCEQYFNNNFFVLILGQLKFLLWTYTNYLCGLSLCFPIFLNSMPSFSCRICKKLEAFFTIFSKLKMISIFQRTLKAEINSRYKNHPQYIAVLYWYFRSFIFASLKQYFSFQKAFRFSSS